MGKPLIGNPMLNLVYYILNLIINNLNNEDMWKNIPNWEEFY